MLRPTQTEITTDAGERVAARTPVIVSASRATDIPACYADWFFERLRRGYVARINPFDGRRSYISFARTRAVVFWSKNPRPLLPRLAELRERGIHCYVQYTLNDYEDEGLEPHLPPLEERIDTFRRLAEYLGRGLVVWRFDPLLLTDRLGTEELLRRAERIGDSLRGAAEKLVFSFADIGIYRHVVRNLDRRGIRWREFTDGEMQQTAAGLAALNERWGYTLAACGERTDFAHLGIVRNRCIDDELLLRHFPHDRALTDYLGATPPSPALFGETARPERTAAHPPKDRGQRAFCGCIASADIGQYATCPHLCAYCYANRSERSVAENLRLHRLHPFAETITGR